MDKVTKGTTKKKLVIPYDVLECSGFQKGAPVDIHPMTDAVIILKNGMTAMELFHAVDQMRELSVKLLSALAGNCESCVDCRDAGDGSCPFLDNLPKTRISEDVLQKAGIPAGAKLNAQADPDNEAVIVTRADHRYDFRDAPLWELEILTCMGICYADLAELIQSEEPVHV